MSAWCCHHAASGGPGGLAVGARSSACLLDADTAQARQSTMFSFARKRRPLSHTATPEHGQNRPVAWCHHASMHGRTTTDWWGVVLQAPDGVALANFYAGVLGWPIAKQDHDEAAIAVPGTSSYLAFESSPDNMPPTWPTAAGRQQMMMHIDVAVDDLSAAVADALERGATLAEYQPSRTFACSSILQDIRSACISTANRIERSVPPGKPNERGCRALAAGSRLTTARCVPPDRPDTRN